MVTQDGACVFRGSSIAGTHDGDFAVQVLVPGHGLRAVLACAGTTCSTTARKVVRTLAPLHGH
jgi:hypothetical protein